MHLQIVCGEGSLYELDSYSTKSHLGMDFLPYPSGDSFEEVAKMTHAEKDLHVVVRNEYNDIVAEFDMCSFTDLNSMFDALDLGLQARYKARNLVLCFKTVHIVHEKD